MPEKKSTSTTSTAVADNIPVNINLGRASYLAEQTRDAVIIFAFGSHPTHGYTDFFEESPIDVFPPQFIFRSIPPWFVVPQVVTPFAIWVMFGASEPVKTVTVHDADGPHEITVDQKPKTVAASQHATWVVGHVRGGSVGARPSTLGIGEEEPGPTWVQGEEDLRFGGRGVGTRATTMATGEEGGGPTTMATGEESQTFRLANTTLAVGEEDPTTLAVGEENPTTQAVGEEGGPTTLAVGEETTVAVRSSPFGTF